MNADSKNVVMLCVLAGLRIFIFAASFPLFNNVDELAHFDLVVKYSHAEVPRSLSTTSAESADYIALYHSAEYVTTPDQQPGGKFPIPLWRFAPSSHVDAVLHARTAAEREIINHETLNPPLYYAMAGLWFSAGKIAGFKGGFLPYWIRFLNVFIVASVVWVAFLISRIVFPQRQYLQYSIVLLAAFIPQDAFYSIQSDVLSPLCFGISFLFMLRCLNETRPRLGDALIVGGAAGATFLIKVSNLPLVGIALFFALVFSVGLCRRAGWNTARSAFLLMSVPTIVPVLLWAIWCHHITGDYTGSAAKVAYLGWTHKPIGSWWPHPIFTLAGLSEFSRELTASVWRGEFVWERQRLAYDTMDIIYWLTSLIFPSVAMIQLGRHFKKCGPTQRDGLMLAFLCCIGMVFFLVILSVSFDFGKCVYPSVGFPYFVSGRLIAGALLPFLLIYGYGITCVTRLIKGDFGALVFTIVLVLAMTSSEIILSLPAFRSQYNWFHL